MEKILLAIDAICPDKNALDFACYLGRLTKSKVTGVFLENLVAEEKPVLKKLAGAAYIDWDINEKSPAYQLKMESVENCINWFRQGCVAREVSYSIHRDRGVPAHEVIAESRFADIIVADAATSFNKRCEGLPTKFMKDILKDSECPVIIAPDNFESVDEIVFSYDGSASSVFAIKQFTYLFPNFYNKPVNIVQVNSEGLWHEKDKYNFKEWLKDHYRELNFVGINDHVDNGLFNYMFKRKNTFLVMGAYSRNALSLFFKSSHADKLIRVVNQPIFISHV